MVHKLNKNFKVSVLLKKKQKAIFSLTFIGLQDIGKWNDIDIGVLYSDIDITHILKLFTQYTCS